MRIMLVEDNQSIVETMVMVLERLLNNEVVVATSAGQAYRIIQGEMVRANPVAFVIADCDCPEMDSGVEFLAFCREYYPHIRRILMSGREERLSEKAASVDARPLVKPFDSIALRSAISQATMVTSVASRATPAP